MSPPHGQAGLDGTGVLHDGPRRGQRSRSSSAAAQRDRGSRRRPLGIPSSRVDRSWTLRVGRLRAGRGPARRCPCHGRHPSAVGIGPGRPGPSHQRRQCGSAPGSHPAATGPVRRRWTRDGAAVPQQPGPGRRSGCGWPADRGDERCCDGVRPAGTGPGPGPGEPAQRGRPGLRGAGDAGHRGDHGRAPGPGVGWPGCRGPAAAVLAGAAARDP